MPLTARRGSAQVSVPSAPRSRATVTIRRWSSWTARSSPRKSPIAAAMCTTSAASASSTSAVAKVERGAEVGGGRREVRPGVVGADAAQMADQQAVDRRVAGRDPRGRGPDGDDRVAVGGERRREARDPEQAQRAAAVGGGDGLRRRPGERRGVGRPPAGQADERADAVGVRAQERVGGPAASAVEQRERALAAAGEPGVVAGGGEQPRPSHVVAGQAEARSAASDAAT